MKPALFVLIMFPSAIVLAEEPQGMPEAVRQELHRLVGAWTGDLSAGGQKVQATFKAEWSSSKDAIIWHWTAPLISSTDDAGKSVVKATGLMGWDASAKRIKELSFNNLGESISRTYAIGLDGIWSGEQSGNYRTDDMKKHVPMQGTVSITFSEDSFTFKESTDYEGELFRNASVTMRRK